MTQGPEENSQEQGDVQGNDTAVATEESKTGNDGETQEETENKTAKKSKKGGKNKKGKKDFDPLKDEIGKFKKIDFEHALTEDEKKSKKAAKKAKKDAKKNKQEEGKTAPPKPPKPKKEKPERKSAEIAPGPETGVAQADSEKEMSKLNPERVGENAIEIAMRLSRQIIKDRKTKKRKKGKKEETVKKEKSKNEKKSKSENKSTVKKKKSTTIKQPESKIEASNVKESLPEKKKKVKREHKKESRTKSEGPVSQVSLDLKVEEIEPTSSKKDLKREESKLKQKQSKLKSKSSLHMKTRGSRSSGMLHSDHRMIGTTSYAKFLEARRSRVMRREESFNYELSSSSGSDEEEKVAAVIYFDDVKKDDKKKKGKRKKGPPGRQVSLVISSDQQEDVPTESDVVEESEVEKEKKKKKKDKKKKESRKSATDEEEPLDIKEKIRRMQENVGDLDEVSSETSIEEGETDHEKLKKKKHHEAKPKKAKKEKKAALTAAQQKLMEEELAAQKAAEEKARLEAEKLAAVKKQKRERNEHHIRQEHLAKSLEFIAELKEHCRIADKEEKETLEWQKYLECRKLPDASKVEIMNTYLHLWEEEIDQTTIEDAAARTADVLQLLEELDDTLEEAQDEEIEKIDNWKWIRQKFREQQAKSLDVATYLILRNIETNMNRIDIPTADYHYNDANFKLSLWLRVQLPVPMHNPRRPPKPRIELNFPDLKLSLLLPNSIEGEGQAIRALYVRYDHLSDLCSSYARPPIPPDCDIELLEATKMEFFIKEKYKYDNRIRKPKTIPVAAVEEENIDGETPQPPSPQPQPQPIEEEKEKEYGPDDEIPEVPWQKLSPSPSQILLLANETQFYEMKKSLKTAVEDGELNLRRFTILGGLYHLNLVEQPPQPQHFVTLDMTITRLLLPKELKHVPFYAPYAPPPPPEPGVIREPEEIEMELKKQEEELDALIFVTITLPDHVIFLEPPTVVRWDKKKTTWRQSDIHDVKHNEEKGFLTFRTCHFGIFGLATNLYSNFPHQAWELKPETDGTVSFQITSAILLVEFNVKGKLIALQQLQNSPNNAIQDIIGVYMRLEKLTKVLQNAGVDIFPAFDAFFYIRGTAEKFWPMEKHLYHNMALLSVCYNFAWSRWNLAAGKRKIVLQMREYTPGDAKQKSHQMLLVTPENALYIDCTEVSPVFNEDGIEGMKFFPDLQDLTKFVSTMSVKNKIAAAPKELVNSLTKLLLATRVLSFS